MSGLGIVLLRTIGGLIWIGFGLGVWKIHKISKQVKDYSAYPKTTGEILYSDSFGKSDWRQVVEFQTPDGRSVLGMHDIRNTQGLPQKHTRQEICYWPMPSNLSYRISGRKLEYYIHYCDDRFYASYNENAKKWPYLLPVIGSALIALGVYIVLFMEI